jgi:SOS response associated peptidase (SRAP)
VIGCVPRAINTFLRTSPNSVMCGRYTLRTPWQRLATHFSLRVTDLPELFGARFNIAPSQSVLAIGPNREGQPAPAFFQWGLVPGWASDPKAGPINARAETVATKATVSEALQKRWCLSRNRTTARTKSTTFPAYDRPGHSLGDCQESRQSMADFPFLPWLWMLD